MSMYFILLKHDLCFRYGFRSDGDTSIVGTRTRKAETMALGWWSVKLFPLCYWLIGLFDCFGLEECDKRKGIILQIECVVRKLTLNDIYFRMFPSCLYLLYVISVAAWLVNSNELIMMSYVSVNGFSLYLPICQVLATKDSNKEFTMVDPLESKRLAAKQMQEIQLGVMTGWLQVKIFSWFLIGMPLSGLFFIWTGIDEDDQETVYSLSYWC